ncbi:MAG: carboxylating nicotinate-nucleotide diphosphorylase [Verrucomicrobiota bacterium]
MNAAVETLIDLALAEDIGAGDVTAEFFIPPERQAAAFITARADGTLSGTEVAARVFAKVDESLDVKVLLPAGSRISAGAVLLKITGSARSIVTAERTALNFLQRLSGVATITAQFADAVMGTGARVLDTRKTTPGFRILEKQAVLHGGGTNHRMGLFDRAMVKDNHLVVEGGAEALQAAIDALKARNDAIAVELEADDLQQVAGFLKLRGVDFILLDNMDNEMLREAVAMRDGRPRPLLEASGGVTLETIRGIAETGVDFISVGALTHSAPALDIGMDFQLTP